MHKIFQIQQAIHDAHFNRASLDADTLIIPNKLSGIQRLNIYRNNTFITLTDALASTFPVINKLVGDVFFTHTASEFIIKTPARPGPLFEYGVEFPSFLDTFEPASSLPYLSDVARFEWAMNVAYHAEEGIPLHVNELANIPESELVNLQFTIHPSCQLITSDYPIDKIWAANQPDGEVREIDFTHGVDILVIRPCETVVFHIISTTTRHFLKLLSRGCTVEHAYTRTATINPDFNPAETIIDLLKIGVFVTLNVSPNTQT